MSTGPGEVELRRWPPPELPEHPYPVLLPYAHPDLMAGRDRELEELLRLLAQPVPIVGLFAPSGAGKSSLLYSGLVQGQRAAGRAVAFDRHPCEPGLAGRLLGGLIEGDVEISDEDSRAFVDRLVAVRRAADAPPILVLDQFEDLMRREDAGRARGVAGALLAATVQRQPGLSEAPCRWVLAYRQDAHGKVVQWLGDVLRDAEAIGLPAVETLPRDLTEPERFQAWSLAPLGTPPPGSTDLVGDAARVFLEAITKPLAFYPLRFAPGLARRLARAFGEARIRSPREPLGPELQVMLAHVLASMDQPAPGARDPTRPEDTVIIEVPQEPAELIEEALEHHLRRALDAAFPGGRHRLGRTRALLALRQLADESGRRREGLSADALAQAIGAEGREVLEKLSTAETRVVVPRQQGGERLFELSHDRMAEVLLRLFDEGRFAALGVDDELLGMRRFVALHSELHEAGETAQATALPEGDFQRIEANAEALLWNDAQRRWFAASRDRHRRDRSRRGARRAVAALLAALVSAGAWGLAARRAERRALLDELARGEPAAAFAAFERLAVGEGVEEAELRALGEERNPFEVLERGLGGVAEARRGEAVVRLAELLMRFVEEEPEDPNRIAPLVWALDFHAREPAVAERARRLRRAALHGLRSRHPPPPLPAAGDPEWAEIPAGTFLMGTSKRRVTVSAFRMRVREVSLPEYRRLVPGFLAGAPDDYPATNVNWWQAYTYAAWLGGRLPTEAEWEYAARAGCPHAYCTGDGSEASLGEAARWLGNSFDPLLGNFEAGPPAAYEPNPWGLFDMHGNVSEWTADPFGDLPEGPAVDPIGALRGATGDRTVKGCFFAQAEECTPEHRQGLHPEARPFWGIRVVLPGPAGVPAKS